MNLQQLSYIVAVDQHQSFSKAAAACHVTQATLSTMVKKLERELEVVLFDRKAAPVITTECGKEIIREARRVLDHSKQLKEIALEVKGKIEGSLRIGVIPTIASNLLHRILPRLLRRYPGLQLQISEITTDNIVEQLKNRELDAGIVSTPLGGDVQLEEEILYYEKLLVYGDSREGAQFSTPEDIADEQIWLFEQGNCLADQVADICKLHTKPLHSNLSFNPNSFDSLLNIVDHLHGLTLIPELYCLDLPAGRAERVKGFTPPYPVREVSFVYHRPYAKMRLINALSQEIRQLIRPLLSTHSLKNKDMRIAKI